MSVEQEFDSNFRYVMVAARRARQLQNGSQPLVTSRATDGPSLQVACQELARPRFSSSTPVLTARTS